MPKINRKKTKFSFRRKRKCIFTLSKFRTSDIDYKDVELLKKFITEGGKILPFRLTGISTKYQRALTRAIKRARSVALLPFSSRS